MRTETKQDSQACQRSRGLEPSDFLDRNQKDATYAWRKDSNNVNVDDMAEWEALLQRRSEGMSGQQSEANYAKGLFVLERPGGRHLASLERHYLEHKSDSELEGAGGDSLTSWHGRLGTRRCSPRIWWGSGLSSWPGWSWPDGRGCDIARTACRCRCAPPNSSSSAMAPWL